MVQTANAPQRLQTYAYNQAIGPLPGETSLPASSIASDIAPAPSSAQAVTPSAPITASTAPAYTLLGLKWPSSSITWAAARYNFSNDVGAGVVFTHSFGPLAEQWLRDAFTRWSALSGMRFVEVADSATGPSADIRVGWANLPSLAPNVQVIGQTTWWGTGPNFIPGVTIQLADPTYLPVAIQPAGPAYYAGFAITVNQVLLHEEGHALGISHASAPTDLMYPIASTSNPDIAPSDLAAIRAIYPASSATVPMPPLFAITDTSTGISSIAVGRKYTGPVDYLTDEYIYAGLDRINVSTASANVFIHGGALDDALMAHSGRNVLDGGTGSNFLTGGSGTDTFFVDDRGPPSDVWSTVVGFGQGDAATIWGVTPQDFALEWFDGQGASGFTGLTLHATAAGKPTASLTLVGYTKTDLSNGRLSVMPGYDPASGSSYLYVHGNI